MRELIHTALHEGLNSLWGLAANGWHTPYFHTCFPSRAALSCFCQASRCTSICNACLSKSSTHVIYNGMLMQKKVLAVTYTYPWICNSERGSLLSCTYLHVWNSLTFQENQFPISGQCWPQIYPVQHTVVTSQRLLYTIRLFFAKDKPGSVLALHPHLST